MVGTLDKLAGGLDRAIGIFAPRAEQRRLAARRVSLAMRDMGTYAAARVNRKTGGWIPADPNVNKIIGSSAPMVRARVRQLVRDFPYFIKGVRTLVNLTIGEGMRLQAKVKGRDGKLNRDLNARIEEAWERWGEAADVAGKLSFAEMARLAKRQELECGEFLLARVSLSDKGRFLPLGLQMFEADWLTALNAQPQGGNLIEQGIEYDPSTGRVAAYHLADPQNLTASPRRILAEYMLHGFETQRPGQLRGISPFVAAVLLAHDLREYLDAELDGAKLASKWLAFIKTPDPARFQELRAFVDAAGEKTIEELENGIIEYLRPGEDVEFKSHNRPSGALPAFLKAVLRMMSVVVGVSYELLSGDYDGISYSNLRGIRNDLADQIKPLHAQHIRLFYRPVYHAFLDDLALSGRVPMPGYFVDPRPYRRAVFMPPGMESMDPLRESRSNMDEMGAGLRSPQEQAAKRGRDLEEVLDDIQEALEMARERGITLNWSRQPIKQNPAALGATE